MPKTNSYLLLCAYVAAALVLSGIAQRYLGTVVSILVLVVWAVIGRFFWAGDNRR